MVTEDQLRRFAPGATPEHITSVAMWFNKFSLQYQVSTPVRIAAFFAQTIHESGSFKYTREIASGAAYEGRKDLGNINHGDGMKYKGRGYIQLTGRNNYRTLSREFFGDDTTLINLPSALEQPEYAMKSALWFWQDRNLNKFADLPVDQKITTKKFGIVTPFVWISILINGGRNGLNERIAIYNRICKILSLPLWVKN